MQRTGRPLAVTSCSRARRAALSGGDQQTPGHANLTGTARAPVTRPAPVEPRPSSVCPSERSGAWRGWAEPYRAGRAVRSAGPRSEPCPVFAVLTDDPAAAPFIARASTGVVGHQRSQIASAVWPNPSVRLSVCLSESVSLLTGRGSVSELAWVRLNVYRHEHLAGNR